MPAHTDDCMAGRHTTANYYNIATSLFDLDGTDQHDSALLSAVKVTCHFLILSRWRFILCTYILKSHVVLQENHVERARDILQRRHAALVNIDVKDREKGNTALIWATLRGHDQVGVHDSTDTHNKYHHHLTSCSIAACKTSPTAWSRCDPEELWRSNSSRCGATPNTTPVVECSRCRRAPTQPAAGSLAGQCPSHSQDTGKWL